MAELYESRHTGAEIDDAVERAKAGGAIDQSLQEKVNPNILDGWYFGNPVDQRQGRIVKPNATYYSDNTLTTSAGTTSAYVTAYRYATGTASGVNYASFKLEDSDTAPTYYAAPENVVRGYTGAGYGIDRWAFSGTSNAPATVIVDSDFVKLLSANSFQQSVENPSRFAGKKLTLSMLIEGVTTGTGQIGFIVDDAWIASIPLPTTTQKILISVTADIPNDLNTLRAWYYGYSGTEYKIYAAKLELCDQQTLAHQDADGNWVLNEIPDYGEQLARCQRYFYKTHYVRYQTINAAFEGPEYSFMALPIPVCMRVENPVLTQSAPIAVGVSTKTFNSAKVKGCTAILGLNYALQETYANACYAYCPTADGVTFTLSADL